MHTQTQGFLTRFVASLERQPARARAVKLAPPTSFDTLDDRDDFEHELREVEKLGAIKISRGRRSDNRHIIDYVELVDLAALYRALKLEPLADQVDKAIHALRSLPVEANAIADVITELETGWRAQRQPYDLKLGDPDAAGFIKALDAVLRRDPADPRYLRTYSRQVAGHSKLIECHVKRIAKFYQEYRGMPRELSVDDFLDVLGLERCPHPVLVAGPIEVDGVNLCSMPWIGLAPETAATWTPSGVIRSILTIENLTSFHLHVKQARQPGDLVIYTGGFASRSVIQALRTVFPWCPANIYHWGDIDPSGVLIPCHIGDQTGYTIKPHLMAPSLAVAHGDAHVPHPRIVGVGTLFEGLGEFLASSTAHHMEQEELDPVSPAAKMPESVENAPP